MLEARAVCGGGECGQGFGALALRFLSTCVGNGRCDLGRDQLKKAGVQLVKAQASANACHQHTGELVGHIRANGVVDFQGEVLHPGTWATVRSFRPGDQ